MNHKGISLLELLAAVALLIIVTVSVALFLPKAVKSSNSAKNQGIARSMAAGRLQELKNIPYATVPARQVQGAAVNAFPTADLTCDCSQLAPDNLPTETTLFENAFSFERRVCVNLVGTNLTTPTCITANGSNDTGYKLIRVAVKYYPTNASPQAIQDAPYVQMSSVISR